MSILITGGMGSLGQYLTSRLVKEGYKNIVLFDLKADHSFLEKYQGQVDYTEGNINYWSDLIHVVEKYRIDEIFHLAAGLSTKIKDNPYLGFKINLEGTINILEIARLYKMNKVIFVSSVSTFGLDVQEPVRNNARQLPTNLYGITKVSGELWGLYYYQTYQIDFRALRFPRLVNPGRFGQGDAAYPSLMIEKAVRNELYQVNFNRGYQVPMIYIKDAVNALLLLYQSEESKGCILNINGILPTTQEIVSEILNQLPEVSITFSQNSKKPHLAIPLRYDDSEAKKKLSWNLEYNLEKMIKAFIDENRT